MVRNEVVRFLGIVPHTVTPLQEIFGRGSYDATVLQAGLAARDLIREIRGWNDEVPPLFPAIVFEFILRPLFDQAVAFCYRLEIFAYRFI